jgi:hypothetical protein
MIYEFPAPDSPIRQGDIFQTVPRIDVNLSKLPVFSGDEPLSDDWLRVSSSSNPVLALVAMRPVQAIVITQDCDTVRVDDIALCEIERFNVVEPLGKGAKYPAKTMSMITKHARLNLKWFYLPPDPGLGFSDKMAVDFHSVLRVSRTYLEQNLTQLRLARLNQVATEHFRERLSEYYRRYPYDEWYPLDKAEFEEYRRSKPEPIEPFPWQR